MVQETASSCVKISSSLALAEKWKKLTNLRIVQLLLTVHQEPDYKSEYDFKHRACKSKYGCCALKSTSPYIKLLNLQARSEMGKMAQRKTKDIMYSYLGRVVHEWKKKNTTTPKQTKTTFQPVT